MKFGELVLVLVNELVFVRVDALAHRSAQSFDNLLVSECK